MHKCFGLLIFFTLFPSFLLAAPYPQYGGTLRCAVYQKPHSLHPAKLSNYAEFLIAANIYEGLVRFDQNNQITLALAKSWEKSSGSRTWLFHIDEDALFHNGKPVTASDVKRSWEYLDNVGAGLCPAMSPLKGDATMSPLNLISGYREFRTGKASEISGVQVVNETVLRLTLTKPDRDFLRLLTLPHTWVFDDSDQPVGSGPFKLDIQKETEIQLVASENYRWGRPYLDRLAFQYYENLAQARFDLAAGNLELVFISPFTAKDISSNELIQLQHKEQVYLWFNPQTFHKPEWKKAVTYAIDIDSILRFQYSMDDSFALLYNPEKAFRRLSSTGWDFSREISLGYTPLSDNSGHAVAERIQRYLAQVSISTRTVYFENTDDIPDLILLSIYKIDNKNKQNSEEVSFLYELPILALRRADVFGLTSYIGGIVVFDKAWLID